MLTKLSFIMVNTKSNLKRESEYEDSPRHDTRDPSRRIQKSHPETQIISGKDVGVITRRKLTFNEQTLLSVVEPKNLIEANKYDNWIKAMNEEMDQIEKSQTWELVSIPEGKNVIRTKWIFKNKLNEDGEVIRNKTKLVCKGYSQVEGIYIEETFSLVARCESIRMILAFA